MADIFVYKKEFEEVENNCSAILKEAEDKIKKMREDIRLKRPKSKKGSQVCDRCGHYSLEYQYRMSDEDNTMIYKCANCGQERQFI